MGLTTCMNVLRNVSVIWPSAGRAWELLNGSKVNIGGSGKAGAGLDVARLSAPHERLHKRSAEHFLDDDANVYQPPPMMSMPAVAGQRYPIAPLPPPSAGANPPTTPISGMPPGANTYYNYDRWQNDGGLGAFAGPLSTSVVPQQYSTGFVERRSASTAGSEAGAAASTSGRGYPQYWSDYSTMNQLTSPYGAPLLHEQVHPSHHAQTQAQAHAQQASHQGPGPVYHLPEQYQMFGASCARTRLVHHLF